MKYGYLKEACVESLEEALRAQELGADRVEYCARLDLDGLTPTIEEVNIALTHLKIPIMVMIRPREGDFQYSDAEFETMQVQIHAFKETGIQGVVLGITKDDKIDFERTKILSDLAGPKEVCFHKAIDTIGDPLEGIRSLNKIENITRILTSGKAKTAVQGISVLKEMLTIARKDLSIMPAGKITANNIEEIHAILGAQEYHGKKIVMRDY